ncbi:MAG: SurA N-terminal domain-containing protein [Gammaproteobacteria bacterium]|nr:SurA N-terminal domain-containing protein [Gammaproteobacteria bacterium]
MMESIRTGVQKPWIKVLLTIVVISFIFAGYFTGASFGGSPDAVAEVDDSEILRSELDQSVQNQAARYGEQFNLLFPTEERRNDFKMDVLDNLINQKVVEEKITELGFAASTDQIVEKLREIPQLQVDGKFSTALLDDLLRSRGWTRNYFQQIIAGDITKAQFSQVFFDTEIALPSEAKSKLLLEKQQRDIRALSVPAASFIDSVEVSDAEAQEYYQTNIEQFKQPESLTVDYIELSVDELKKGVTVEEDAIKAFYESNQARYRKEEQRQVAHILITTEERSDEEAKAKADQIAQQLSNGGDFAELAKAESDDFTGENGGDLGVIARGVMDESFENAMFALANIGDISPVVKTEYGYHIIKLLDIQSGEAKPLEEVRAEIVDMLKSDEADKAFFLLKDKVKQLAYERSDSLSAAAAEANAEIKTSEAFPPQGGAGIFATPALLEEAYGERVLVQKRNSKLIEVGDGKVVILRANTHTPARTQSLEEVNTQVMASVRQRKAAEMAKTKGEAIVAELNNGGAATSLISELGLEWKETKDARRNSTALGFEVSKLAFKAPKPVVAPTVVSKASLNGDYLIVQVTKVTDFDAEKLTEAELQQAKSRVERSFANSSYSAFVEAAREDVDVKVFKERLE